MTFTWDEGTWYKGDFVYKIDHERQFFLCTWVCPGGGGTRWTGNSVYLITAEIEQKYHDLYISIMYLSMSRRGRGGGGGTRYTGDSVYRNPGGKKQKYYYLSFSITYLIMSRRRGNSVHRRLCLPYHRGEWATNSVSQESISNKE